MAYKDAFNKSLYTYEKPENEKPENEKPENEKDTPLQNPAPQYSAPAPAPAPAPAAPADPGYVAPNRVLTMPETGSYDVAAPDAYTSRWQAQIDSMMGDILNRQPFQYDLNSDALYNQATQRYIQQGQMAMMDTMGQASAMTGGYGNSYAQQAGQQAYQGYLQGLNDNIAQYYQMAYDRYNQEGNDMRNNLSMLNQAEASDYGRYQDKYNQWYNERAYADSRSDAQWARDYQYQKDQLSLQDENYNRLAGLISNYGYQATDEELAAAGMSRSIADTMRNAYIAANTPKATGGGYSSGTTGNSIQKSIIALGYGPRTVESVADLIAQGKVKVENDNGKLIFSNAGKGPASSSTNNTRSKYFSNRVDPLELLKNTKKK